MDIIIVEFVLVAFKIIILLTGRGRVDGEGEGGGLGRQNAGWEWLEIHRFNMIIDL